MKPPETRTPEARHQNPERMMRESGARLRDVPELIELVHAYRGSDGSGTDPAAIPNRGLSPILRLRDPSP